MNFRGNRIFNHLDSFRIYARENTIKKKFAVLEDVQEMGEVALDFMIDGINVMLLEDEHCNGDGNERGDFFSL